MFKNWLKHQWNNFFNQFTLTKVMEVPPKAKTVVFILSMHRSGSSALTGVLHKCLPELDVGQNELKTCDKSQPNGYFENQHILAFNDALLTRLGTTWYETKKLVGADIILGNIPRLVEILTTDFNSDWLLIKDPRIVLLWPLYQKTLQVLGWHHKVIKISRNTLEVVGSLQSRNAKIFSNPQKAVKLVQYYEQILATITQHTYSATFDELLMNPLAVVENISIFLGLPLCADNAEYALAFIDPKLKHEYPTIVMSSEPIVVTSEPIVVSPASSVVSPASSASSEPLIAVKKKLLSAPTKQRQRVRNTGPVLELPTPREPPEPREHPERGKQLVQPKAKQKIPTKCTGQITEQQTELTMQNPHKGKNNIHPNAHRAAIKDFLKRKKTQN